MEFESGDFEDDGFLKRQSLRQEEAGWSSSSRPIDFQVSQPFEDHALWFVDIRPPAPRPALRP